MSQVLVLVAHPDLPLSRVNRRLLDAALALKAEAPQRFAVRELYSLYPDFALDVAAEQAAAARAELIVWQHPIQWRMMPALMKFWLDEVLGWGWAHGPATALAGKHLWPVLSAGATDPGGREAFLAPYAHVARVCRLRLLEPLLLQGSHAAKGRTLDEHAQFYAERLRRYPEWAQAALFDAGGA